MAAASLQSKMPGPLPCLAPLPGSGPLPSLVEEIASQNRSMKRKSKELETKVSTLDRVVAQLSNDNLVVHREMDAFCSRIELLEKVFMFVNFDELQKVATKLAQQHVEPAAETLSPRTVTNECHQVVDAEIAAANLVEHFVNGNVLSSSSESLHAAAAAAVKPAKPVKHDMKAGMSGREDLFSSSENLLAAAAAEVKPAKLSKKSTNAGQVVLGREEATLSPVISAEEGRADAGSSEELELLRVLSRTSAEEVGLQHKSSRTVTADDTIKSTLRRPRSKAEGLRGAMSAKTPPLQSQVSAGAPHIYGDHAPAIGTNSSAAIRFQPRRKCLREIESANLAGWSGLEAQLAPTSEP